MKKFLILTVATITTTDAIRLTTDRLHRYYHDPETEVEFSKFNTKMNKNIRNKDEYEKKYHNFEDTYQRVKKHNEQLDKTFTMKVNKFADMDMQEFKDHVTGFKMGDDVEDITNLAQT